MKRNFYSLIIITALILGANGLSAQNRGYVAHNGYDIGLGFGASYQKSDMRNFSGGAGTFFVGHSLFAKPGAFFGMDWRLRFLGGRNLAFDDRMNADSTYSNVQYTHFNYDLEFELYLNRLRENTGIIIGGFGGGGVTHNITAFDLTENGVPYDFSEINAAGDDSRITIYEDLTALSDKQFETKGINHACFSPTLGLYLGYQFTPHFSMGIEHKMNYMIYEYNTGSGADIDGRNVPGSKIDRNNYTSLELRWDIGGGNNHQNVPCEKPAINFSVVPATSGYYSHHLSGTVYNVDNSSNITITVDGQPDYNFSYVPGANNISSNYNLAPGSHIIKVTASTRCGSDTQTIQVIVEEPCIPPSARLSIYEPVVDGDSYRIEGQILNVASSEQISVEIDGINFRNFTFDNRSGKFVSIHDLYRGSHYIVISVRNECGQDSESFQVTVGTPCDAPIVNLSVAPNNYNSFTHQLNGTIANVENASNIVITVDGVRNDNFRFVASTDEISAMYKLETGTHTITVSATTECGQDTQTVMVTIGTPCKAPTVDLTVNETTYNGNTHEMIAKITGVDDASGITVKVDGQIDPNFRYVASTGQVSSMYKLAGGNHVISVTAKNSCGQDSETVKISVATPCIPPTITVNVNESTGNNFTHQLSGIITNINKPENITITVDGIADKNFKFIPSSGQITSSYKFTPGVHNISIKVTNECGQDSETVQVVVEEPCDLPVIKLTVSPSNNASYTHILAGRITNVNNAAGVTVTVDGEIDRIYRFNPADGQISANYKFGPGSHTIVIIAKNDCGEVSKTETIEIAAPCNLPVVTFQMSEIDHPQFTHQMNGSVTNVNNKSDITVTVDGVVDNSFQFVPNTKVLSGKFKLTDGKHTITVKAKNSCGEDTESIVVTVSAPCDPPVINFKMSEITHPQFTHEMTGTITNVKNKSDITVTVDGVIDNSFQYVPSTMVLSGKFKLGEGKHTIVVTAKNECGSDTETVTVTVGSTPCDPPVINFKMSEITNPQFTHEMTGTITNVKNKSDITVTVDGVADNSFQYVPSTMVLSGKFKLGEGKHTIVVTAKNECGSDTETVTVTVGSTPCDPPVINFKMSEITHPQFTHEMTGTITNVKNKSDITVTVDGVIDNSFQFVPSTMVLSGKFKLGEGKHTIVVTAKNECGSDTETVTVTVGSTPCDPPVINFKMSEITHPQFTHEMTGTIANVKNKSDITVTVDGVADNSFQYVPSTMVLSGKFKLGAGKHTIVVTAKNECGSDTETITVTVAAPCDPPVINFKMSEITHPQFTHEMTGTITNVKNKSDITVTVDGVADNSFQYVPSTMVLSGKFKLSAGKHTIVVTAKNECGEDTETITVTVAEPCNPPVINFKMSEITHPQFTHEMTGTITNVKNKSDITVTVDGVVDNSFQFVPSTMVLSGKFKLSAGKHTIVVTAKNECGEDTETITVTVAEPCNPPVINFKMSEITNPQFTHEMTGTITNVKNKSDITVTVDGVADNSFQYVPSTMVLSGKFKLSAGTHKIVVKAKNECGEDTENLSVTVAAPCNPPVVNFKVSEIAHQTFTHEISGTVTGVKTKTDITVTIDGVVENNFSYVPTTNAINGKIKLTPGSHKIVVKGKNECGEDTETINVTVADPCIPPTVAFSISTYNEANFTHQISGKVNNVSNKDQITVTVDGKADNSFTFVPSTSQISMKLKLEPGTHNVVVKGKNDCGEDTETQSVTVETPCIPPVVSFTVSEITETGYTHKYTGTVTNVTSKNEITVKVDGVASTNFTFNASTGAISGKLNINVGSHTIVITAKNDCGEDSKSKQVVVKEPEACGPRFEPGNADWQFCLITPSGTYNRSDLTSSFSYNGNASSLFFKATAGGGNAIVGGNPYEITPGKYYLFTGSIKVKVSTSNPGSMGQWSVCIEADKAPQSGTGNTRPTSPCEPVEDDNDNDNNGNNGDKGGSTSPIKQGGGTNVTPNRQGSGTNVTPNREGGSSTTTKPTIKNQ